MCILCCALSALGMYALQNPFGFLLSRLMAGVASSAWVSFTVLYSSYFDKDKASAAVTILSSANYGGRLLSYLSVGLAVSAFGADSSFLIAFIVGSAGFVLSFFITDIKVNREPLKLSELMLVVKNKTLIAATALAIIEQIVCFATFQTFTSDMLKMAGAGDSQLSLLNAMLTLPVVIVSLAAGKLLIKRFGEPVIICAGFLLKALYCFVLPFAKNIALLYLLQFIGGMGTGLAFPVLNGLCIKDIEPQKKTTAMGFYQAMYSIGMTLGPIIMGFLVAALGYAVSFAIIGAISLSTALAIPVLFKNKSS
ncbi:MAG TPA: hypothetical protein DCP97_03385 [Ruminococcaceae bacterium]|nr:hypothetical protein [Oscillospiraceae bacterium]